MKLVVQGLDHRYELAMSLEPNPSDLINDMFNLLPATTSIAVVKQRNFTSFDISSPLMNLCKNFSASRSASFVGLATNMSKTFLLVAEESHSWF